MSVVSSVSFLDTRTNPNPPKQQQEQQHEEEQDLLLQPSQEKKESTEEDVTTNRSIVEEEAPAPSCYTTIVLLLPIVFDMMVRNNILILQKVYLGIGILVILGSRILTTKSLVGSTIFVGLVFPLLLFLVFVLLCCHTFRSNRQSAFRYARQLVCQRIQEKRILRQNKYDIFLPRATMTTPTTNETLTIDIGLIFYPGALIEHIAYAPLASQLSDSTNQTILVILPSCEPLRIVSANSSSSSSIIDPIECIQYMQSQLNRNITVKQWAVGGHSSGASVAYNLVAEQGQQQQQQTSTTTKTDTTNTTRTNETFSSPSKLCRDVHSTTTRNPKQDMGTTTTPLSKQPPSPTTTRNNTTRTTPTTNETTTTTLVPYYSKLILLAGSSPGEKKYSIHNYKSIHVLVMEASNDKIIQLLPGWYREKFYTMVPPPPANTQQQPPPPSENNESCSGTRYDNNHEDDNTSTTSTTSSMNSENYCQQQLVSSTSSVVVDGTSSATTTTDPVIRRRATTTTTDHHHSSNKKSPFSIMSSSHSSLILGGTSPSASSSSSSSCHPASSSSFTRYITIMGGNHSGFGYYGPQTFPIEDGIRTISLQEQQSICSNEILDFLASS